MPCEDTYYQIALTLVTGIGPIMGKALATSFDSAKDIFLATEEELVERGNIHRAAARSIKSFHQFAAVKQTLKFIVQHGIQTLFVSDPAYPNRLRECPDPPTLLYYKGTVPFNERPILSIIGTRTPTDYGREVTTSLLKGLAAYDALIVSGLADGIDSLAHRCALGCGLPTIGVLGHGLDTIYPPGNRLLAKEILHQGGLLTEYREGTPPAKYNFPRRNRIVAGIPEALVIVETAVKGGSVVTASLASGYNRDIFAFPGRTTDPKSMGCNALIRQTKAAIVTSAADIARHLNWEKSEKPSGKGRKGVAPALGDTPRLPFPEGSPEHHLYALLSQSPTPLHIDDLIIQTRTGASDLAPLLLFLELDGWIEALPGLRYRPHP